MKCTCDDWIRCIIYIDTMSVLAWDHGMKLPDYYPPWKYCPWCGKELIREEGVE